MSLKEEINKQVDEISNTISNEDEKKNVLESVNRMINIFVDSLASVSEKQSVIENRVEEIYDVLSQIEEEMIENFAEDFEAECPYCGEKVPLKFPEDEKGDIECPKCHNVIELELMLDDKEHHCHCDCDDCHGDCDDECDCDDCNCDDEDEE